MKTKTLIYCKVEHNWDKCDKQKESHPFTSFNGGYLIPAEEMHEEGYRDYALANLFMQSDYPFVIRESGGSGNLNGIISKKEYFEILKSELELLTQTEK